MWRQSGQWLWDVVADPRQWWTATAMAAAACLPCFYLSSLARDHPESLASYLAAVVVSAMTGGIFGQWCVEKIGGRSSVVVAAHLVPFVLFICINDDVRESNRLVWLAGFLPMSAAGLAAYGGALVARARIESILSDYRANHICQVCGYDLRATPDRCPECGTVPSHRRILSSSTSISIK